MATRKQHLSHRDVHLAVAVLQGATLSRAAIRFGLTVSRARQVLRQACVLADRERFLAVLRAHPGLGALTLPALREERDAFVPKIMALMDS